MTRAAAFPTPLKTYLSPSALPDYYGDERRARRRVRVRHVVGWIGLAVCVAGVVEAVRLLSSSRRRHSNQIKTAKAANVCHTSPDFLPFPAESGEI
jgi:hypothetical protein